MTMRSVKSRGKRKQPGVFDYTDEDDRVEEISKQLLRKFDSPVTKTSSSMDKYEFLRVCECLLSEFSIEFLFRLVFGYPGNVLGLWQSEDQSSL